MKETPKQGKHMNNTKQTMKVGKCRYVLAAAAQIREEGDAVDSSVQTGGTGVKRQQREADY
jgi:hypothetical protein